MLWLLVFAPLAIVLDSISGVPPYFVFFAAAIAIVPIAALIVEGTEHLSVYTGPTLGGLLNATFGNLPELIISFVALRAGLVEMVRASIVGALLANLLLGLGLAFLLGGLRKHVQDFNPVGARVYSSMMLLAAISMAVPATFHRFFSAGGQPELPHTVALDKAIAVVLLLTYGLYLVYQLKTHKEAFEAAPGGPDAGGHGAVWSKARAIATLVAASAGAAWLSEILVGSAEKAGEALGMSPTFIGLVILAGVGGAAEIGSAIAMGRRDKMDLAVGISLGSCIQITLFVAPVLVLLGGLVSPRPFTLSFTQGEMGFLFMSAILGAMVAGEGRSNWFKGVQLLVVYAILAVVCYLVPAGAGP
jgi:Ca2+:H+ antiporter